MYNLLYDLLGSSSEYILGVMIGSILLLGLSGTIIFSLFMVYRKKRYIYAVVSS